MTLYRYLLISLLTLVLVAAAQAAPHCMLVRSYRGEVRLTSEEAQRILDGVREILCGCPRPAGEACAVSFEIDGDIRSFTVAGHSRAASSENQHDFAQIVLRLPHRPGGRSAYLVKHIPECPGPPEKGQTIAGCSSRPGQALVLRLTSASPGADPSSADSNETRTSDWYDLQAKIWAHELGHNLGMPDNTDDPHDLMSHIIPFSPVISPGECTCFLAPFTYETGCQPDQAPSQPRPRRTTHLLR